MLSCREKEKEGLFKQLHIIKILLLTHSILLNIYNMGDDCSLSFILVSVLVTAAHFPSSLAKIAECQNEIFQARAMVEEAEQYLTVDGRGGVNPKKEGMMGKNEERLESIKAASLSAIIGTLAGLPISFARVTSYSELILNVAITFVSCALFGVTFRYAIRRDLDNFQLKSGIAAAFGFVKGLATLEGEPPLQLDSDSIITYTFHGAVYISEDLLIFLFAAVGLDFFIKLRILRPFPTDQSVPKTKFVK